jgi:hypothetical protein
VCLRLHLGFPKPSLLCHVLIDDPKAKDRSLMLKKPSICNGQATGHPCKHYWFHTQKVESNNPDELRSGEKHRACLISPGFPVEFSDEEIPHVCNQYSPRKKTGLRGLLGQKEAYDATQEEYNPLTPEEVRALRANDDPTPLPEVDEFSRFATQVHQGNKKGLPIVGQSDATETDLEDFLGNFKDET